MKAEDSPLIRRAWAMPSADTFSILPIAALLRRWLKGCSTVVDPFARNSEIGTHRNDLNPETRAQHHMEAQAFCRMLVKKKLAADAVLFDPPYSPRQISEVYQSVGRACTMKDTQNARLYKEVKDELAKLMQPGSVAISCGWNSSGFGKARGFVVEEILLVAHGGAHNDTIVVVETLR